MRLITTDTLQLHEFHNSKIPEYAILSHRWGQNEVSFEDLQCRNKQSYKAAILSHNGVLEEVMIRELPKRANENTSGWQKIKGCCSLAAAKGFKYAWVDTCCINKESSAELTEAINSMFRWYCSAEVCLAYLSDVHNATDDPRAPTSAFRKSEWFTRSWTLQEMLAPRIVEFYSSDWKPIGTVATLNDVISELTGVPSPLHQWRTACIAEKMSWASKRVCERPEDMAYSLLGLFGVYMPMLYGEGRHAFYRLQLEIIKQSDDESIFAWTLDPSTQTSLDLVGLLAESPKNFAESKDIRPVEFIRNRPHYSITNKGLQIETPLTSISQGLRWKVMPLNCSSLKDESKDCRGQLVPHPLVLCALGRASNVFTRVRPQKVVVTLDEWRDAWTANNALLGSQASTRNHQTIYILP